MTPRSLRRLFVWTGLSLTLGAAGLRAQAPLPVWQSSDTVVGDSATITLAKPAGTAVNDLLFVAVGKSAGAAGSVVTAPGGWSGSVNTGATAQIGFSSFFRVAQAGEPASYDFTITGGVPWVASITRVTGAHRTAPIPHSGALGSLEATGSAMTTGLSTTTANNLMLNYFAARINGTFSTPPSTTERFDAANTTAGHPSMMLATVNMPAAGFAPGHTSTMSASGYYVSAQLAVRPPQLATVVLNSIGYSNYSMLRFSSNISDAGGTDILERGVVYSETALNSTPTLGGASVLSAVSTDTTNSYDTYAIGFKAATSYTFRAYVTNTVGTAYSTVFPLTTAAPSNLNTFFSGDGNHPVDLGDTDNAANVIVQGDGKPVLLVNRADAGRASLARLTTAGVMDTSFSGDGRADLSVPASTADGLAGVVLQNNGRIVVAGQSTFADGSRRIIVARFLADGTQDTEFDGDGVAVVDAAGLEYGLTGANAQAYAADVALQTDGKIVVAGRVRRNTGGKDNGLVLRLNADGSVDGTFGGNGVAGVEATSTENTSFAGVEMQPDDKIVLGGSRVVSGFDFQCLAARLTAAGALDSGFGTGGLVLFDANTLEGGGHNEIDQVWDVKLAPDGGILLAIEAETASFTPRYFVARLNRSNGALDSGFGGNGVINTGVAGSVAKMEVQGDGRILLAGGNAAFNTTVLRLLPTGAFDTDWDSDGILVNTAASSATGVCVGRLGFVFVSALDNAFSGGSAHVFNFRGDTVTLMPTLTPLDNATGAGVNDNLVLSFGTAVVPFTGSIEIIHAHTFAVLESIPVTDARVTGGGTGTITINPDATLAGNTKYYVRVPFHAFRTTPNISPSPGISNTMWEFTTTAPVLSSNADLSALALSAGALDPAFAPGTTAYTATVLNPAASITVTPTKADAGASIEARVNGGGYAPVTSGSPSGPLALNVGPNTVDVRVTAEDGTTMKTYTVTVTRESAPTDITLTPSSRAENNAANATVGTLAAVDGTGPYTFTLAAGDGDADNGSFNILGTALRLTNPVDFETQSSYALRVQVEDDNGYVFAKALTVSITNVNEVPSFTKGANQVHTAASGAQSVPGWATAIDDGDSTVTQAVSFEVTLNSNPGLFTTAPAVAANGTLTYTLSGTTGAATITLRILDDTSIGGQPAQASATQNFTITNQPAPNYVVTYAGGHLTCTDISGNGDTLVLRELTGEAGSVRLFASGRTFSVNGGLNTNSETAAFATADLNSVTLNAGAGNDTITILSNITGSTLSLPGLTINGGTGDDQVNLSVSITFKPDASLNVDLQDDDATPGTDNILTSSSVQLLLSGTGGADFKASRRVAFASGSVLEVENGNILVEANQQAVATAGSFSGQEFLNARVEATGSGSVTLRGRSGNGGAFIMGVAVRDGAQVLAGAGGIVIEGSGQGGHTNGGNYGVSVGAGLTQALVKAVGGDISITGVAGSGGTANLNIGVVVEGQGEVEATGAGKATLHGTGGNTTGTGPNNHGIFLNGSARVTTENGKLTLTGISGGGAGSTTNIGVNLFSALLVGPTGTGDLQITGTPGGAGAGVGVNLTSNALLSTPAGDITISGTAAPQGGDGVSLANTVSANGGDISITGAGAGTVNGHDGITASQLISTTGTGSVTLHGTAAPAGHGIGVTLTNSTSTVQTGGGGISITGIGGSGGTSNLSAGVRVGGLVSGPAPGGSLTIHGTGGSNGQAFPHGVEFLGANADAATSGGDISITGIAGDAGAGQAHGVNFVSGAGINADAGSVTLHGTGGAGTGSTVGVQVSATEVVGNGGIHITGVGGTGTGAGINLPSIPSLVTTGGDITLHGTGSTLGGLGIGYSGTIDAGGGDISLTGISTGTVNNLHGIVRSAATTTTGTGTITMHGTASPDGHGSGILLGGTAPVTTGGGGISLTGIGGGAGTTSGNSGVLVNGAVISGPGAGSALTIHGTGGASTQNFPHGVEINGGGQLLTSGGDIVVTGIGGANSAAQALGVNIPGGSQISAGGTGAVTLTGTGGAAAGNSQFGVFLNGGTVSTNDGPISVTGTAGDQSGTLSGSRGIYKSSGTVVIVGGDHDLTLVADSMALAGSNTINAAGNDVIIRQKTAGTAITLGAEDTVTGSPLVLGLSDVELDAFVADEVRIGNADTGAMTVAGAISPLSYPVLRLAKPVTFADGGSFVADITSETVFERMIVDGGITLQDTSTITGAVLGGFVPSATAVIPVIQGNDGVTGVFTGRPEGWPMSLTGLTRRMRLTYAAGGGNHIAFYSSPIVVLRGNGQAIAKGDATPSTSDHTDFGGTLTAGSNTVVRTFEILNDGLAPLTGISADVDSGAPAGAFSVTSTPDATLASGVFSIFNVTFDPAANGIQSSTVTVTSDQPLDSPYSFAIQGEGTYPEITVYDGTVLGTELMDDTGEVDFGDVERSTTGAARLFTIRNTGTGPMSGIAVTKGVDGLPAEFGLDVGGLSASLLPNTSTTFTVALTPESLGPRGAMLEIASTDEDENPFEVHLIGEGVPPAFAAVTDQFMLPDQGMDGGGRIYRPLTGVINQDGFITFRAQGAVGSGGITNANDSLLLSDVSGELRVVAREGGVVQTTPWQTLSGLFTHFVLSEGGESVALDRVAGAPTSTDYAYIGSPDGLALEILSREGDAAPSAGVFKTHTAKPAVDAQGRVYFSGDLSGAGITTKTDTGIYQESGGSVVEIIREGDDVSAQTGDPAWLGAVSNYVAAAGDGVVFTASLQNHPTDTTQKTDTALNAVVMAGNEAALAVIARKGDVVPGTGVATMKSFSGVSRGGADSHAFLGLMNTGGGVTTANDQVLVAAQGGNLHLVAREGVTQVSDVTLTKFADFYACAGGVVIFEASGVVCRWTESGGIEELARAGAAAPGMGGATFSSIGSLSVSDGGAVALVTPLSNGQTALWRALPGGALSLVTQTSDVIVVDGTPQTILGISIHAQGAGTGGGGGGMGAAINDDGYLFATLSLGGGNHVARVFP